MPRLISIMDAKKRDAQIEVASPRERASHTFTAPTGQPVTHQRLIKGTEKTSYEALLARFGTPDEISLALISGDPEIDLGQVGRRLAHTSRVYLGPQGNVLYVARILKIVRDARGQELSREDFVDVEATVGEELPPVPWSGRLLPITDVVRRFAFVRSLQLRHVNGLTFDFLLEMARALEEAGQVMHVRAGAKGKEPLIFQTNGTPFHGFLEGRTQKDEHGGDAYRLVLHLSNLEIKRVPESDDEAGDAR